MAWNGIGLDRIGSERIWPECTITMAVIEHPNRERQRASLALTSKRKCLNLVTTTGLRRRASSFAVTEPTPPLSAQNTLKKNYEET